MDSDSRVGVLVIGSLFWDEAEHRTKWRQAHLDLRDATLVTAPIRYGRVSATRGETTTMVFSRLVERTDYGLGIGVVIPCRATVRSAEELIEEAEALWRAESSGGNPQRPLCASWGAVGALFSDGDSDELRHEWSVHVRKERYPDLRHLKSEGPVLNPDGTLAIKWPRTLAGSPVSGFDVILATANCPTLKAGRYPDVAHSAGAWARSGPTKARYFFNNVEAGIRTFQDHRIWSALRNTHAVGSLYEAFPKATEILDGEVASGA